MNQYTYTERLKKKSLSELKKLAQEYFNAFIRRRDAGRMCISCKSMRPNQAGHYYPRGSYPGLALDEDNTFLQDVSCNLYKSGNPIEMRKGMINRIGEERVLELDQRALWYKANHFKPDRFYYIEKILLYKSK